MKVEREKGLGNLSHKVHGKIRVSFLTANLRTENEITVFDTHQWKQSKILGKLKQFSIGLKVGHPVAAF